MCWTLILFSLSIGCCVGYLAAALMFAAKRSDP